MINGLDLFSGIGGNTIAFGEWIKTIAYCEADRHAQAVLLSRMGDGNLRPAPIWDDVTSLHGNMFDVPIDIIIAGFPCQDISVAGKGAGLDGKRSGLVFEIFRLIRELQPAFVFLENVPAIRTRGGERVVKELAALGYDCRWDCLSAFDVGAPQKRERWFLLAHSTSHGWGEGRPESTRQQGRLESAGSGCAMEDTNCGRSRHELPSIPSKDGQEDGSKKSRKDGAYEPGDAGWWTIEPNVGRVANGIPLRVDRLKRLGNGVVPAQAREAFMRLMGISRCSS